MAYVNPYASAMEYQPRTLWNQPKRKKYDWSNFWGKAEEDDDGTDSGDDSGYNPEVGAGDGATLKSLWGDVMADIQSGYDLQQSQNMFDSVFGPGITATNEAQPVSNTQQFVGGWQNPDYTGPPMVTDFITDVSLPANTGGNTQPELNLDFITDVSLPANNTQNADVTVNALADSPNITSRPLGMWDTDFIANVPDWRDMVGPGGLTANEAALSYANAPTVTYGNTDATNPTIGEILNADIEDDEQEIEWDLAG